MTQKCPNKSTDRSTSEAKPDAVDTLTRLSFFKNSVIIKLRGLKCMASDLLYLINTWKYPRYFKVNWTHGMTCSNIFDILVPNFFNGKVGTPASVIIWA